MPALADIVQPTEADVVFWPFQFYQHLLFLVEHMKLAPPDLQHAPLMERALALAKNWQAIASAGGRGLNRELVQLTERVKNNFFEAFRSGGNAEECSAELAEHTLIELADFNALLSGQVTLGRYIAYWMTERATLCHYLICNSVPAEGLEQFPSVPVLTVAGGYQSTAEAKDEDDEEEKDEQEEEKGGAPTEVKAMLVHLAAMQQRFEDLARAPALEPALRALQAFAQASAQVGPLLKQVMLRQLTDKVEAAAGEQLPAAQRQAISAEIDAEVAHDMREGAFAIARLTELLEEGDVAVPF